METQIFKQLSPSVSDIYTRAWHRCGTHQLGKIMGVEFGDEYAPYKLLDYQAQPWEFEDDLVGNFEESYLGDEASFSTYLENFPYLREAFVEVGADGKETYITPASYDEFIETVREYFQFSGEFLRSELYTLHNTFRSQSGVFNADGAVNWTKDSSEIPAIEEMQAMPKTPPKRYVLAQIEARFLPHKILEAYALAESAKGVGDPTEEQLVALETCEQFETSYLWSEGMQDNTFVFKAYVESFPYLKAAFYPDGEEGDLIIPANLEDFREILADHYLDGQRLELQYRFLRGEELEAEELLDMQAPAVFDFQASVVREPPTHVAATNEEAFEKVKEMALTIYGAGNAHLDNLVDGKNAYGHSNLIVSLFEIYCIGASADGPYDRRNLSHGENLVDGVLTHFGNVQTGMRGANSAMWVSSALTYRFRELYNRLDDETKSAIRAAIREKYEIPADQKLTYDVLHQIGNDLNLVHEPFLMEEIGKFSFLYHPGRDTNKDGRVDYDDRFSVTTNAYLKGIEDGDFFQSEILPFFQTAKTIVHEQYDEIAEMDNPEDIYDILASFPTAEAKEKIYKEILGIPESLVLATEEGDSARPLGWSDRDWEFAQLVADSKGSYQTAETLRMVRNIGLMIGGAALAAGTVHFTAGGSMAAYGSVVGVALACAGGGAGWYLDRSHEAHFRDVAHANLLSDLKNEGFGSEAYVELMRDRVACSDIVGVTGIATGSVSAVAVLAPETAFFKVLGWETLKATTEGLVLGTVDGRVTGIDMNRFQQELETGTPGTYGVTDAVIGVVFVGAISMGVGAGATSGMHGLGRLVIHFNTKRTVTSLQAAGLPLSREKGQTYVDIPGEGRVKVKNLFHDKENERVIIELEDGRTMAMHDRGASQESEAYVDCPGAGRVKVQSVARGPETGNLLITTVDGRRFTFDPTGEAGVVRAIAGDEEDSLVTVRQVGANDDSPLPRVEDDSVGARHAVPVREEDAVPLPRSDDGDGVDPAVATLPPGFRPARPDAPSDVAYPDARVGADPEGADPSVGPGRAQQAAPLPEGTVPLPWARVTRVIEPQAFGEVLSQIPDVVVLRRASPHLDRWLSDPSIEGLRIQFVDGDDMTYNPATKIISIGRNHPDLNTPTGLASERLLPRLVHEITHADDVYVNGLRLWGSEHGDAVMPRTLFVDLSVRAERNALIEEACIVAELQQQGLHPGMDIEINGRRYTAQEVYEAYSANPNEFLQILLGYLNNPDVRVARWGDEAVSYPEYYGRLYDAVGAQHAVPVREEGAVPVREEGAAPSEGVPYPGWRDWLKRGGSRDGVSPPDADGILPGPRAEPEPPPVGGGGIRLPKPQAAPLSVAPADTHPIPTRVEFVDPATNTVNSAVDLTNNQPVLFGFAPGTTERTSANLVFADSRNPSALGEVLGSASYDSTHRSWDIHYTGDAGLNPRIVSADGGVTNFEYAVWREGQTPLTFIFGGAEATPVRFAAGSRAATAKDWANNISYLVSRAHHRGIGAEPGLHVVQDGSASPQAVVVDGEHGEFSTTWKGNQVAGVADTARPKGVLEVTVEGTGEKVLVHNGKHPNSPPKISSQTEAVPTGWVKYQDPPGTYWLGKVGYNEDGCAIIRVPKGDVPGGEVLYVLSVDGMGGHGDGDHAKTIVIRAITEALREGDTPQEAIYAALIALQLDGMQHGSQAAITFEAALARGKNIKDALAEARRTDSAGFIRSIADDAGVCLTLAQLTPTARSEAGRGEANGMVLSTYTIGDARTMVFGPAGPHGEISRTRDNSWVMTFWENRSLADETAARTHPQNNIVLGSLTRSSNVTDVEIREGGVNVANRVGQEFAAIPNGQDLPPGTWVVSASDGLWDKFDGAEVYAMIKDCKTAAEARDVLYAAAMADSVAHPDNLNIVVTRVGDAPTLAAEANTVGLRIVEVIPDPRPKVAAAAVSSAPPLPRPSDPPAPGSPPRWRAPTARGTPLSRCVAQLQNSDVATQLAGLEAFGSLSDAGKTSVVSHVAVLAGATHPAEVRAAVIRALTNLPEGQRAAYSPRVRYVILDASDEIRLAARAFYEALTPDELVVCAGDVANVLRSSNVDVRIWALDLLNTLPAEARTAHTEAVRVYLRDKNEDVATRAGRFLGEEPVSTPAPRVEAFTEWPDAGGARHAVPVPDAPPPVGAPLGAPVRSHPLSAELDQIIVGLSSRDRDRQLAAIARLTGQMEGLSEPERTRIFNVMITNRAWDVDDEVRSAAITFLARNEDSIPEALQGRAFGAFRSAAQESTDQVNMPAAAFLTRHFASASAGEQESITITFLTVLTSGRTMQLRRNAAQFFRENILNIPENLLERVETTLSARKDAETDGRVLDDIAAALAALEQRRATLGAAGHSGEPRVARAVGARRAVPVPGEDEPPVRLPDLDEGAPPRTDATAETTGPRVVGSNIAASGNPPAYALGEGVMRIGHGGSGEGFVALPELPSTVLPDEVEIKIEGSRGMGIGHPRGNTVVQTTGFHSIGVGDTRYWLSSGEIIQIGDVAYWVGTTADGTHALELAVRGRHGYEAPLTVTVPVVRPAAASAVGSDLPPVYALGSFGVGYHMGYGVRGDYGINLPELAAIDGVNGTGLVLQRNINGNCRLLSDGSFPVRVNGEPVSQSYPPQVSGGNYIHPVAISRRGEAPSLIEIGDGAASVAYWFGFLPGQDTSSVELAVRNADRTGFLPPRSLQRPAVADVPEVLDATVGAQHAVPLPRDPERAQQAAPPRAESLPVPVPPPPAARTTTFGDARAYAGIVNGPLQPMAIAGFRLRNESTGVVHTFNGFNETESLLVVRNQDTGVVRVLPRGRESPRETILWEANWDRNQGRWATVNRIGEGDDVLIDGDRWVVETNIIRGADLTLRQIGLRPVADGASISLPTEGGTGPYLIVLDGGRVSLQTSEPTSGTVVGELHLLENSNWALRAREGYTRGSLCPDMFLSSGNSRLTIDGTEYIFDAQFVEVDDPFALPTRRPGDSPGPPPVASPVRAPRLSFAAFELEYNGARLTREGIAGRFAFAADGSLVAVADTTAAFEIYFIPESGIWMIRSLRRDVVITVGDTRLETNVVFAIWGEDFNSQPIRINGKNLDFDPVYATPRVEADPRGHPHGEVIATNNQGLPPENLNLTGRTSFAIGQGGDVHGPYTGEGYPPTLANVFWDADERAWMITNAMDRSLWIRNPASRDGASGEGGADNWVEVAAGQTHVFTRSGEGEVSGEIGIDFKNLELHFTPRPTVADEPDVIVGAAPRGRPGQARGPAPTGYPTGVTLHTPHGDLSLSVHRDQTAFHLNAYPDGRLSLSIAETPHTVGVMRWNDVFDSWQLFVPEDSSVVVIDHTGSINIGVTIYDLTPGTTRIRVNGDDLTFDSTFDDDWHINLSGDDVDGFLMLPVREVSVSPHPLPDVTGAHDLVPYEYNYVGSNSTYRCIGLPELAFANVPDGEVAFALGGNYFDHAYVYHTGETTSVRVNGRTLELRESADLSMPGGTPDLIEIAGVVYWFGYRADGTPSLELARPRVDDIDFEPPQTLVRPSETPPVTGRPVVGFPHSPSVAMPGNPSAYALEAGGYNRLGQGAHADATYLSLPELNWTGARGDEVQIVLTDPTRLYLRHEQDGRVTVRVDGSEVQPGEVASLSHPGEDPNLVEIGGVAYWFGYNGSDATATPHLEVAVARAAGGYEAPQTVVHPHPERASDVGARHAVPDALPPLHIDSPTPVVRVLTDAVTELTSGTLTLRIHRFEGEMWVESPLPMGANIVEVVPQTGFGGDPCYQPSGVYLNPHTSGGIALPTAREDPVLIRIGRSDTYWFGYNRTGQPVLEEAVVRGEVWEPPEYLPPREVVFPTGPSRAFTNARTYLGRVRSGSETFESASLNIRGLSASERVTLADEIVPLLNTSSAPQVTSRSRSNLAEGLVDLIAALPPANRKRYVGQIAVFVEANPSVEAVMTLEHAVRLLPPTERTFYCTQIARYLTYANEHMQSMAILSLGRLITKLPITDRAGFAGELVPFTRGNNARLSDAAIESLGAIMPSLMRDARSHIVAQVYPTNDVASWRSVYRLPDFVDHIPLEQRLPYAEALIAYVDAQLNPTGFARLGALVRRAPPVDEHILALGNILGVLRIRDRSPVIDFLHTLAQSGNRNAIYALNRNRNSLPQVMQDNPTFKTMIGEPIDVWNGRSDDPLPPSDPFAPVDAEDVSPPVTRADGPLTRPPVVGAQHAVPLHGVGATSGAPTTLGGRSTLGGLTLGGGRPTLGTTLPPSFVGAQHAVPLPGEGVLPPVGAPLGAPTLGRPRLGGGLAGLTTSVPPPPLPPGGQVLPPPIPIPGVQQLRPPVPPARPPLSPVGAPLGAPSVYPIPGVPLQVQPPVGPTHGLAPTSTLGHPSGFTTPHGVSLGAPIVGHPTGVYVVSRPLVGAQSRGDPLGAAVPINLPLSGSQIIISNTQIPELGNARLVLTYEQGEKIWYVEGSSNLPEGLVVVSDDPLYAGETQIARTVNDAPTVLTVNGRDYELGDLGVRPPTPGSGGGTLGSSGLGGGGLAGALTTLGGRPTLAGLRSGSSGLGSRSPVGAIHESPLPVPESVVAPLAAPAFVPGGSRPARIPMNDPAWNTGPWNPASMVTRGAPVDYSTPRVSRPRTGLAALLANPQRDRAEAVAHYYADQGVVPLSPRGRSLADHNVVGSVDPARYIAQESAGPCQFIAVANSMTMAARRQGMQIDQAIMTRLTQQAYDAFKAHVLAHPELHPYVGDINSPFANADEVAQMFNQVFAQNGINLRLGHQSTRAAPYRIVAGNQTGPATYGRYNQLGLPQNLEGDYRAGDVFATTSFYGEFLGAADNHAMSVMDVNLANNDVTLYDQASGLVYNYQIPQLYQLASEQSAGRMDVVYWEFTDAAGTPVVLTEALHRMDGHIL